MTRQSTEDIKCPVCSGTSQLIANYKGEHILAAISAERGLGIPEDLKVLDYCEYVCTKCELEFADPMVPGDDQFYAWITEDGTYYAQNRWEFAVVLDYLRKQFALELWGLDVGCGGGQFIGRAMRIPGVYFEGIDTSPKAVLECQRKGYQVSNRELAEFGFSPESVIKEYDVVTFFHSLEHVSEPVEYLRNALRLVRLGGAVFFSVPYSPQQLEMHHFLPKNHPPHHLTRWNCNSLKALAEKVGSEIEFILPNPKRAFVRARYALAFKYLSPDEQAIRRKSNWIALRHPIEMGRYWRIQRGRQHVFGGVAPSEILCKISRMN